MSPPSSPDQELLLSLHQALAGFLGAIIMVMSDKRVRTRAEQISSILGGVCASVYLTEPLVQFFYRAPVEPRFMLGFSFCAGVLGLRLIEMISQGIEKKIKQKIDLELNEK